LLSVNNLVYDHRKLSLLIYVLTALALIYGTALPLPKWAARLCQYLGNLSYPLYLFHFPAFLLTYLGLGVQNSGVLLGAALLVSAGFYHAVDVPVHQYFKGNPFKGKRS
jgi:peptidoglycan/LPS O-acetylase OafA/YrhL